MATQKGLDGKTDFEATAAAVDANSVELADAIGSVYGDEREARSSTGERSGATTSASSSTTRSRWRRTDNAGQTEAVDYLTGYSEAFTGFLADATGLPQDALQKGIRSTSTS